MAVNGVIARKQLSMQKRFLCLLLLPALYACTHCGPQAEPDALVFMHGDSLQLDSVYAIGAVSNQVTKGITTGNVRSGQFKLPLSLHADSSSFVFKFRTRTDTLTIFYRREFYHKQACGFVVDLAKPNSGSETKSSFQSVRIAYYPYVYRAKNMFSGESSGIYININL